MRSLYRRLSKLEVHRKLIAARQGWNAKQVLFERIEATAARLRAGGRAIPETGPLADAVRSDIERWLARLRDRVPSSAGIGGDVARQ